MMGVVVLLFLLNNIMTGIPLAWTPVVLGVAIVLLIIGIGIYLKK